MNKSTFYDLPYDVLNIIFGFLCNNTFNIIVFVSKNLYALISRYGRLNNIPKRIDLRQFVINGNVDLLEWSTTISIGKPDHKDTEMCALSATHNYLNVLKWLREHNYQWDYHTCVNAAERGNMEILKWAINKGCPVTENVYIKAVIKGRLMMLQWLINNEFIDQRYNCAELLNMAARYGHLNILKWLHTNNTKHIQRITYDHLSWLPERITYDQLSWLPEGHRSLYENVCSYAARGGHLQILKWAKSNGYKWCKYEICKDAAYSGNIEMIKWLREHNNCSWDSRTCDDAAKNGHL